MFNRHSVFILFSLSAVFILLIPELLQRGMFMDGTQYACVAKNLAHGKGSFWFPYLSASWSKSGSNFFLEHPPLSYYLQSKFFIVLGDSVFTEKTYCFIAALLCGFLIYKIWRLLFDKDEVLKHYWWLAIFLWFITPSVFWSFSNNMIENTVSVMVLASVYFAFKAILSENFSVVFVILAALFIFLGSLTKGLPAIFPIAFFACSYVFTKSISFKRTVIYTLLVIFVPVLLYSLLLYFNPSAYLSLSFYLEKRLLNRISNAHLVENRFTILFWVLTDLFVILGILLILISSFKLNSFSKNILVSDKKYLLLFASVSMCGILPLCFTHVQRATYFVPAIPFFGIAFAIFIAKGIHPKIITVSDHALKIIRYWVFIFSSLVLLVCFLSAGKTSRDKKLLEDVDVIGSCMPNCKEVGAPYSLYTQWDFQFYLLRYYDISLFPREDSLSFLIFKKTDQLPDLSAYEKQSVSLNNFVLYKKRD